MSYKLMNILHAQDGKPFIAPGEFICLLLNSNLYFLVLFVLILAQA